MEPEPVAESRHSALLPVAKLLGQALALGAFGLVVGLSANALRPSGVHLRLYEPKTSCQGPEHQGIQVQELPPSEISALCGSPSILIVDVRKADRYAEGHIADAVHLPCSAPGKAADDVISEHLGGKSAVVVYGDSTQDARNVADSLAQRAKQPGLRVIAMVGGFSKWSEAGFACESGDCAECSHKVSR